MFSSDRHWLFRRIIPLRALKSLVSGEETTTSRHLKRNCGLSARALGKKADAGKRMKERKQNKNKKKAESRSLGVVTTRRRQISPPLSGTSPPTVLTRRRYTTIPLRSNNKNIPFISINRRATAIGRRGS